MAKHGTKVEWNYIGAFALGLVLWMFIGVPILNMIVEKYSVLIAFPVFMLIYSALFFTIGKGVTHKKATQFALVLISAFFVMDIWVPPMLIPFSGPTQLAPEQSLASDVFFYTIFTSIGTPHLLAWVLTYFVVPVVALFILAYSLSGKKLDDLVRRV